MTRTDTTPSTAHRGLVVPAVAWLVAGLGWLTGEAVSASAWPGYSYATNYISDLGVPDVGSFQGRAIDSPLHGLMNATFVGQGVLFGAATVLAAVLLRGASRRARVTAVVLGAVHLVGMVLVGSFHGSQASTEDGTIAFHVLGAAAAITTGNVAAIVAAASGRRTGATRGYRVASAVLGVLGLVALVMLVVDSSTSAVDVFPDGVWERGSVYTIIAWEALTGALLLVGAVRRRSAERA